MKKGELLQVTVLALVQHRHSTSSLALDYFIGVRQCKIVVVREKIPQAYV